ncbi:MAG: hypothetical protein RXN81_01915 [Caldisphaera sp.]
MPIVFYPFAGIKQSFFGDLNPQDKLDYILLFINRKVIISRSSGSIK